MRKAFAKPKKAAGPKAIVTDGVVIGASLDPGDGIPNIDVGRGGGEEIVFHLHHGSGSVSGENCEGAGEEEQKEVNFVS